MCSQCLSTCPRGVTRPETLVKMGSECLLIQSCTSRTDILSVSLIFILEWLWLIIAQGLPTQQKCTCNHTVFSRPNSPDFVESAHSLLPPISPITMARLPQPIRGCSLQNRGQSAFKQKEKNLCLGNISARYFVLCINCMRH